MKTFFAISVLLLSIGPTFAQSLEDQFDIRNFTIPKNELQSFTSDGCSSFPDGTLFQPKKWQHCCVIHDIAYWAGGSEAQKLKADLKLRSCVSKAANPILGEMMYQGVRVGGSPFLTTTWRWGYGWKYKRGYRALSEQEKQLTELIKPINIESIEVTDAEKNYFILPSPTGNYCQDEAIAYLKQKHGEAFDVEEIRFEAKKLISSTKNNANSGLSKTTVKIKTSLCSGEFLFNFGKIGTRKCTKGTYEEKSPKRLKSVQASGDCKNL